MSRSLVIRRRAPGSAPLAVVRAIVRALVLALVLALMLVPAACAPPSQQDLQSAQAMAELGESFNDIRLIQQELQDQVDSLRLVVARQDSVIRALANLAGVQVPQ